MEPQRIKKVSQNAFDDLISTHTQSLSLASLLKEAGFSTELDNIHIHLDEEQSINFYNCQMNRVIFSGNLDNSYFYNTVINNSVFHETSLEGAYFGYVHLNNVSFDHAKMKGASFYRSQITKTNFEETDFSHSIFFHTDINATKVWHSDFTRAYFSGSKLENTVFAQSDFYGSQNDNNQIKNIHVVFNQPYHSQDIFVGVNQHWIKPTILTVGDVEWHDVPYATTKKYGAIVDTVPQYIYDHSFNTQLSIEVKAALDKINHDGLQAPSIAQQVLYSDQPTIHSIKEKGWQYVENVDAILLPGSGSNVHPEFYGESSNWSSYYSDYYREILEFSLIDAAIAMDKPILGICHGSQIVNVYLGGTLHQNVDGQVGIAPLLDIHTREGLLGSVLEDTVLAPSYHHQAVKDIAPSLEVVASYDGVIKATQAKDDKKIMLTQFHPEFERDQSSKNILSKFVEISADLAIKDKFISLSDVLGIGNNEVVSQQPFTLLPLLPSLSGTMCIEDPAVAFA
jgi:gamma-glutamyl-gamma-aminobutyrate hydrolase PuuD/uncharacterized protein YjbI with pentapeptide repeats